MQKRKCRPLEISFCCLALAVAAVLAGLLAAPGTARATMGAECKECHSAAVKAFVTSYHGRAWKEQGAFGCQSCHGPVERHVQSGGDPAYIISYKPAKGAATPDLNKLCLDCHQQDTSRAYWQMGAHATNGVDCISCHTLHQPQNKVNELEVCLKCHRDIRSDVNKMSHHPLSEGKIECSSCHNPHGSVNKNMIKAETVNQLCYKCHADKRGPFVYPHPPVDEDCLICHTPHGSRNAKLLVRRVPNLCQDCHDWSRHPGTPYDAKTGFTGSSPNNRFFARSCLDCHGAIHGSTNFENNRLTR